MTGAGDLDVGHDRTGREVLDQTLSGRVDDRGADLGRGPQRVLPADDGRRAGQVRGGHRGAAEERPATGRAAGGAWDRAQDVDAVGHEIRLDPEVDVRRPLAAEVGLDVVVGRAEVGQDRADRRALAALGLERGRVGQTDHVGGNRGLDAVGRRALTHRGRVTGDPVGDEDGDRPGQLRVADLRAEVASAAADQRDLAGQRTGWQARAGHRQAIDRVDRGRRHDGEGCGQGKPSDDREVAGDRPVGGATDRDRCRDEMTDRAGPSGQCPLG